MNALSQCRHQWKDVTEELAALFAPVGGSGKQYYACRLCLEIQTNLPVTAVNPADKVFPPLQSEDVYFGE